jgi:hypothetical protein
MAASPAAYGSRESAANESVLECDPSPEPIRHRPVARSIIAAPCSNLPLCGFESSTLGGLVAIFFALFDWMAELLWFRAIGYEGVFWRLRIAEVAMFAIAFVPVFVSEGMRAQASTCRLR